MEKHSVYDVFTPTMPAILTFVERKSINDKLVDSLRTPGKQLVVYGHSGSGKTTLLVNKLKQLYEDHITTRCMSGLTFDQLMIDAFDQLNPYYTIEEAHSEKRGIKSSLSTEYLGIKSKLEAIISEEKQVKQQRVLPPQLTPQRLATFIGEANCCWVLEDFHKIHVPEKEKLSQVMKIFMDMSVIYSDLKIIAIGAVGTAREVVAYDSEMKNRVAEIHVPLMNPDEIMEILNKGQQLLNINITSDVKSDIVSYSNGLASVCHQLGLNLCIAYGIYETCETTESIDSSKLGSALMHYIEDSSDTIKAAFDKALKRKKKYKYDNCRLILKTLTETDEDEGLTRSDILNKIRQKISNYPTGNLTIYLKELQSDDRGSIIKFDESSGKYTFANPFHKVFSKVLFSSSRRKGIDLDKFKFVISEALRDKIEKLFKESRDLVEAIGKKED